MTIDPDDYHIMVSCLPPEGEAITREEFREKYLYEFGRRDAVRDSADIRILKKKLANNMSAFHEAYVRGYREYGNAYLVINRY